jgi:poly-gamma-glutamate capsule biosynthesis protein CapA/YwtB (metallophosphatase superfamily)
VDATVNALEAAGIAQSGMARSADEVLPTPTVINGISVAHLSYTSSFNGIPPLPGEPWRSNLIDPQRVIADARAVRQLGAEAVIVSFHWGDEKVVQPTPAQRQVAEAVTASGEIDLIVGHHAHVLQPIEQVNDVWVVWGMGNVLSNHPTSSEWPAESQDGAVFTSALQRNDDGTISVDRPVVYPTWCDTDAGYIIRLTSEANDPASPLSAGVRAQLQASHQRTAALLGDYLAP